MVNEHDGLFPLIYLKEDEGFPVGRESGLDDTFVEGHEGKYFPGVELIEEKHALSSVTLGNKVNSRTPKAQLQESNPGAFNTRVSSPPSEGTFHISSLRNVLE